MAKERFNARFPHLRIEYYTHFTIDLLDRIYPKFCPHCEVKMQGPISGRETGVRCKECHYQGSRTSCTPLAHFKIPLWTFGYVLLEAIQRYPGVLSSEEIRRRLGVSGNTALLLKRRLQVLLSDLMPTVKDQLVQELKIRFRDFDLPEDSSADLTKLIRKKPVINMDCVALFSATQRSNGGRKRFRHTGQTASIYLSDKVAEEKGKYQIGTLCHTIAVKKGPVILDSIPDQKQKTIQPLLDFLPPHTPTFTDEGYPWLSRYNRNHRAVNHSARAKDRKRSVWARNRWSKNGVHNQAAEGFQRILKHSFISGYSYIRPQFSLLYLNEYATLKSIRVYTLETLINRHSKSPHVRIVQERLF